MDVITEPSWKKALETEFAKPYFVELSVKVQNAYQHNTIFPEQKNIFRALELCPFSNVRVVILGQDPYHGVGQAHGLSFSVLPEIKIPPSLKNIYKEIAADIGTPIQTSGNLERWATQGVLLLNATLTVQSEQPGSHQGWGWETFTNALITKISDEKEHVVFLLWGKYAQAKAGLIDEKRHLVLTAPHPSPFSAHTGFLGCKHFSKTNAYLEQSGLLPINW